MQLPSPPHVIDSGQFIQEGAQLAQSRCALDRFGRIAAHELIDLPSAIQNGAHVVGPSTYDDQ